ncbi:RNA-binding transcriptional accessory protein [Geothermobacter hydrogeniphilus]|uniref:RNA-binding transcriptional accessory protein n=1 Tax=Geothermobacter hydrogeniphilus TaxID=1969733 RepID=A0A2K2HAM7_9BACT|nr:RNA-binding transcriptional accessory protein [Geothermobacter hydrogeniphilus]
MELTEPQRKLLLSWLIEETSLPAGGVARTVELLGEGATVPFIARYRKEATGELDEVQIRAIEERWNYLLELEERRETVLKSIADQQKLTAELEAKIRACRQKTELEDLYLPYRPRRRTKAMIARERGLEPLAEIIWAQQPLPGSLDEIAAPFVDAGREVADTAAALAGAGHILAERIAEDAEIRAQVRRLTWEKGEMVSKVARDREGQVSKYEMYYDYREPLKSIPSHRLLAMRRGEKEDWLRLSLAAPEEEIRALIEKRVIHGGGPFAELLRDIVRDAYARLLAPAIEVDLRLEAKQAADAAAIEVFAENLKNLLLQPAAGPKRTLGIDPGLRTGSKLAAVDATGRFLAHATIYPHTGGAQKVEQARAILVEMVRDHAIELLAVGNGTAGREMEQFARQTLGEAGIELPVVLVNEAGASVYSASEIARDEFPDLDLTVRGAVSIARRLQDPLAELVKIDPKSIGVGQYQHDVNQNALQRSLDATVESAVNWVGVNLNTASWRLLSYVSGLGENLARNIVAHRDVNGPFASRGALLEVSRFGPRAFELAAGFLRLPESIHPLDNTAVHPERYALVERMAADLGCSVAELCADPRRTANIDLQRYVSAEVGLPTLRDILAELQKPGRDPREKFEPPRFRDDVREISDLREGMTLDGTVTNVAAFGAFVDIGVHQDGLVHVSELAHRFVRDPAEVVKVGQQVKVKVLSVDGARKRIGLSIKQTQPAPQGGGGNRPQRKRREKSPDGLQAAFEKAGFRVKK